MGRKPSDIIGMRFGNRVVTGVSDKRTPEGKIYYTYLCDCGNTGEAIKYSLMHSKTCGCKGCKRGPHMDIVGKRFGRRVVTGVTNEKDKKGYYYVTYLCDCGNTGTVRRENLRRYDSCGCKGIEVLRGIWR